MSLLVSPSDLPSSLGADQNDVLNALSVVSEGVRELCGWNITQETKTEAFDGEYRRSIWIPTLLLTDVASVVEGVTTLVYDRDYTWTSTGRLIRNGRWSSAARGVTVTYTHGYPETPGLIKQIVVEMVTTKLHNPFRLRSETRGPFSWTAQDSVSVEPLLIPFKLIPPP